MRLYDPANREQDLGAFASRPVDEQGSADTQPGYYLWEYEPGELEGKYQLDVLGIDGSGRRVKAVASEFMVIARYTGVP